MSSIEIRKYEYQDNRAKNYFASPTYIDGITLDKILIDGFPIFNEEFANQFDSFEYKASDYDLVFSRLENTLTTTLNQSLETFLSTDLDNHCLVAKVTIGEKTFGGLIDVNSISFIDDLTSDGYRIKVTIFSMAKEFSLFAQGKPRAFVFGVDINTFMFGGPNYFFKGVDDTGIPNYSVFNTALLDWNSRIGYTPVIIKELWQFLINNNVMLGVTTWKLFEDVCTSFGIIYKFEFNDSPFNEYFDITISLAFRDTGFSSDTISVNWLHRERGFISDINANVIQCIKHQKEATIIGSGTVPIQVNEDHFYGTVFNKDDIATYDGDIPAGYSFEEGIYANGDGISLVKLNDPFPFSVTDKVNTIDMNYYFAPNYAGHTWNYYVMANSIEEWYVDPQVRKAKYISFPRMFTKAGYSITEHNFPGAHDITTISHPDNIHTLWASLIENTGGVCYPYLLQTFRKSVSGKISLLADFNVNLFDKITVNEETYTIYKLSNLDFNNKEVDIYAIQD